MLCSKHYLKNAVASHSNSHTSFTLINYVYILWKSYVLCCILCEFIYQWVNKLCYFISSNNNFYFFLVKNSGTYSNSISHYSQIIDNDNIKLKCVYWYKTGIRFWVWIFSQKKNGFWVLIIVLYDSGPAWVGYSLHAWSICPTKTRAWIIHQPVWSLSELMR